MYWTVVQRMKRMLPKIVSNFHPQAKGVKIEKKEMALYRMDELLKVLGHFKV